MPEFARKYIWLGAAAGFVQFALIALIAFPGSDEPSNPAETRATAAAKSITDSRSQQDGPPKLSESQSASATDGGVEPASAVKTDKGGPETGSPKDESKRSDTNEDTSTEDAGTASPKPEATSEPEAVTDPPPGTESAPPGTESAPPGTESAPPGTESAPPETESAPPETESAPPETESAPPETESAPPETESAPPGTESAPPETESAPPETESAPPETESAPPAARQAATPVDLNPATTEGLIREVFKEAGEKAVQVARCESELRTDAQNGQFLGLFQMGASERARYGHGQDALVQTQAAYELFRDRGWQPWTCA